MAFYRIRGSVYGLIVILGIVVSSQQDNCGDINADTLQLLVVMFRHGDRTPYSTYPTDPYQKQHWDQWGGFGQLTQLGMKQHYLLGRWFRDCYRSFLSDKYSPKDLLVRSTDVDRTLMSAQVHLAGVYPPNGYQVWSDEDAIGPLWQPIPIHTVPKNEDYLLITDMVCPPYDAVSDEVYQPIRRSMEVRYRTLLEYIATNAGMPVPVNFQNLIRTMSDAILVERLKGLKFPSWVNSTVVDLMEKYVDLWINTVISTDEMVRYAGGELFSTWIDLFTNKTKGTVTQKHIIYSAHDSTMRTLLSAYGDYNKMTPPYRSAVITELHLDKFSKRYFVKAFYRNDTQQDPYPITIKDCGTPCYFEQFVQRLKPFRMVNKKKFCQSPPANMTRDTPIIQTPTTTTAVWINEEAPCHEDED